MSVNGELLRQIAPPPNLGNTKPGDGLAASPPTSLEVACEYWACEYWREHGLNTFADRDDIATITHRINAALNGIYTGPLSAAALQA